MVEHKPFISLVIPCYAEAANIDPLYESIVKALLKHPLKYEIIFVDDGSPDDTLLKLQGLSVRHKNIKIIELSRNFGKEAATSAGIHAATGDAIIMLDADGQHPVELLPDFIAEWRKGAQVVVGVRKENKNEGFIKKYGSLCFYKLFNKFSGVNLVPGSTDYRLIDKTVQSEFNKLRERDRITRGLIDWLGYKREYIYFSAKPRLQNEATYTFKKLFKLALDTFVSSSFTPLYLISYLGLCISVLTAIVGLFVIIEDFLLRDPLNLNISGSGYLGLLILFLVGIILISQGMISLYISHIYTETKDRPLYVVNKEAKR